MRTIIFILMMILFMQLSCTKDKTLFEESEWWTGHWQNMDDPTLYFSVGFKPIGGNKIQTPQFFISSMDSIYVNFYQKTLLESDHKKRYKIVETNEASFIKIQEIDELHLNVYGPSDSMEELGLKVVHYSKLIQNDSAPIADSILFQK